MLFHISSECIMCAYPQCTRIRLHPYFGENGRRGDEKLKPPAVLSIHMDDEEPGPSCAEAKCHIQVRHCRCAVLYQSVFVFRDGKVQCNIR